MSVQEREPLTVLEVDRPLREDEAARIKEQFLATVDDRPVIVHGPGLRVYEIEQARLLNRVVVIMSATGLLLSVIGLVLVLVLLLGGAG